MHAFLSNDSAFECDLYQIFVPNTYLYFRVKLPFCSKDILGYPCVKNPTKTVISAIRITTCFNSFVFRKYTQSRTYSLTQNP
jgi:hypothetical protein